MDRRKEHCVATIATVRRPVFRELKINVGIEKGGTTLKAPQLDQTSAMKEQESKKNQNTCLLLLIFYEHMEDIGEKK